MRECWRTWPPAISRWPSSTRRMRSSSTSPSSSATIRSTSLCDRISATRCARLLLREDVLELLADLRDVLFVVALPPRRSSWVAWQTEADIVPLAGGLSRALDTVPEHPPRRHHALQRMSGDLL